MENKYVCSVDIGGTKIATASWSTRLTVVCPIPFLRPRSHRAQEGGEAVFQRIEASIKAALEANPDVEVLGVGIGAAGVVDPKTAPSRMPMRSCPAGPAFSWGRVCARISVFPLPL